MKSTCYLIAVFAACFSLARGTADGAVAISVSSARVTAGDTGVSVLVAVDDAGGVAGGDLTLTYDDEVLTARQVQAGPLLSSAGIVMVPNLSVSGRIRIAMAGASALPSGGGTLVSIVFDVKSSAASGAYELSLQATLRNENAAAIPVTLAGGSITVIPESSGSGLVIRLLDASGSPGDAAIDVALTVDGASGLAGGDLVLEYDSSLLVATQVTAGDALLSSGIVLVGNVTVPGEVRLSLAGAYGLTSSGGTLATITFSVRPEAAAGATELTFTKAVLRDEASSAIEATQVSGSFTISDNPPQPSGGVGPLALDADLSTGDQQKRELTPAPGVGEQVQIDVVLTEGGMDALGVEAVLEYDENALAYSSFQARDVFSGALGIPVADKGRFSLSLAFVPGKATKESGSVGTITFTLLQGFNQETVVELVSGQLAYSTGQVQLSIGSGGSRLLIGGISSGAPTGDFDGDGLIGFVDFIGFAQVYGSTEGDGLYLPNYDMNQDGSINFNDFIAFAQVYGTSVGKVVGAAKPLGRSGLNAGSVLQLIPSAGDGDLVLTVQTEGAVTVTGYQLRVTYDPATLAWQGAEALLDSHFRVSATSPAIQVNRTSGEVLVADAFPATQEPELVRLRFRRLTSVPPVRVAISHVLLADPEGRIDALPGANLTDAWDVNAEYTLLPGFPNPFNPATTVPFAIPESAHVSISVHNLLGQTIAVLVDHHRAAGSHSVKWDGNDHRGRPATSGVYLVRMKAGSFSTSRKIVLLK
jgi:hypothetical protein